MPIQTTGGSALVPQLLDEADSRAYLGGIGRTLFYALAQRGDVTRVKLGRRSLFTKASLDAYVDRLASADSSEPGHDPAPRPEFPAEMAPEGFSGVTGGVSAGAGGSGVESRLSNASGRLP